MAFVDFDEFELDEWNVHFWRGVPFTGIAVERYGNGSLRCTMPFENGLENGVARDLFQSGVLKAETCFVDGARKGTSKEWYESGALKTEAVFEYGICVSKTSLREDGTIISEFKLETNDPLRSTIELLKAAAEKRTPR